MRIKAIKRSLMRIQRRFLNVSKENKMFQEFRGRGEVLLEYLFRLKESFPLTLMLSLVFVLLWSNEYND